MKVLNETTDARGRIIRPGDVVVRTGHGTRLIEDRVREIVQQDVPSGWIDVRLASGLPTTTDRVAKVADG